VDLSRPFPWRTRIAMVVRPGSTAAAILARALILAAGLLALFGPGALSDLMEVALIPVIGVAEAVLLALALSLAISVAPVWWARPVVFVVTAAMLINVLGWDPWVIGASLAIVSTGAIASAISGSVDARVSRTELLFRVVTSALARVPAAFGLLLVALIAWVGYGAAGFRHALMGHSSPRARIPRSWYADVVLAVAARLHGVMINGPHALPVRFSARPQQIDDGPMRWTDAIHIVRERVTVPVISVASGQRVRPARVDIATRKMQRWNEKKILTREDRELAQIGIAIGNAYDATLRRLMGKKLLDRYDLRISAWVRDTHYVFVVKVQPFDAQLAAGKTRIQELITAIDHATGYTAKQLTESLVIGDQRVANDPMRGGETGIFIGIERRDTAPMPGALPHAPEAQPTGDPIRDAIQRQLVEDGYVPDQFRFVERQEDYGKVQYVFRSDHWRGGVRAAQEAVKVWLSLAPGIAFYAKVAQSKVSMTFDHETHSYLVTLAVRPPAFPGDDPDDQRVSLLRWVRDNADEMAHFPRRFAAGLNYRGDPVWVDFGQPITPHALIVGGAGSGKTVSALVSAVVQLAAANPPAQFRLWLVDPKHELVPLIGDLPHVERAVIAQRASDVLPLLAAFDGEMRRRRARPGYKWSPATRDPWLLLVIEEWQALVEGSKGDKDQEQAVKTIAGQVSALAAISRSAGGHIALLSQKGTADIVPSAITTNLPVHIVGRSRPADYDQMLETREVRLDRAGKLAIGGIPQAIDGPLVVAGFVEFVGERPDPDSVDRGIRKVVEEFVIPRHGRRSSALKVDRRLPATGSAGHPDDAFDPWHEEESELEPSVGGEADSHAPAARRHADLKGRRFGPLECARELYSWQIEPHARPGWLRFSARLLLDRLGRRYGEAPREQTVRSAVRRLVELGIVNDIELNGRPYRQLRGVPWPEVVETIEAHEDHARLFDRRAA
jgi:hypothetical protein